MGNTAEEVWKNLLAGKSGVARITEAVKQGAFKEEDLPKFACQIAAEVKNFDPLQFIEKKELKKMGRFIHLALAAADEAMKASGLQVTPEISERVGVHIGSGIGGFDVIEREHISLLNGGPRKISPFFIPAAIVNLAAGPRQHPLSRPRARTKPPARPAPPAPIPSGMLSRSSPAATPT